VLFRSVAVLTGACICTLAAFTFAATPASRAWRGERHEAGWLGPLTARGMRTVFAVLAAFGTGIGIVQVLLPAFAGEHGSAATGGLFLALLSVGSLLGGIVYGARSWPGSPVRRLPVLLLGLGAGFALLATASAAGPLAILLVLSGTLIAPTATVASTLLDTVAPAGTVTEAFAAMVMGIVAGNALGNALGGAIVDAASYETGALAAGSVMALAAAVAVARRRTLDTPSA